MCLHEIVYDFKDNIKALSMFLDLHLADMLIEKQVSLTTHT